MRLATVRSGDGTGTWAATVEGTSWSSWPAPTCGPSSRAATSRPVRRRPAGWRSPTPTSRRSCPSPARSCASASTTAATSSRWARLPSHPTLFAKYAARLHGPATPSPARPSPTQVDWEAELAIVIGQPARREAGLGGRGHRRIHRPERRLDARLAVPHPAVAAGQDLGAGRRRSALARRRPTRSTARGRPARHLRVDGQVMQDARTSDLLSIPSDSWHTSATFVTLEPGDVIATGTPGGVGHGQAAGVPETRPGPAHRDRGHRRSS